MKMNSVGYKIAGCLTALASFFAWSETLLARGFLDSAPRTLRSCRAKENKKVSSGTQAVSLKTPRDPSSCTSLPLKKDETMAPAA